MSSSNQASPSPSPENTIVNIGNRPILHPPYVINNNNNNNNSNNTIPIPTTRTYPLCKFCQSMIDQWSSDWNTLPHHASMTELRKSAVQGCTFCCQFLPGSFMDSESRRTAVPGFVKRLKCKPVRVRLVVEAEPLGEVVEGEDGGSRVGGKWQKLCVELFPGDLYPPAFDHSAVSGVTSTLDGLHLCRKWLRSCVDSHGRCSSSTAQYEIPTRLLAIGGTSLQLQDMRGRASPVKYATLSHCWGGKDFLKLLRDNLDGFRQNIPHDEIPKTFQDAIFIARYLGFEYLWIDSLCIIQDDKDDWERESTLMIDVYGGSALNIAAVSAENGNVGCFFQRQPRCLVQLPSTETGAKIVPTEVKPYPDGNNHRTPLFKRGWVLQERHLPRRTLYFYEKEISWSCREASFCESGSRVHPIFHTEMASRDKWTDTVERYSSMALTESSDRLVAIGGLAKVIQGQTGDEYIAGVWRQDLDLQLLWFAYDSKRVDEIYRAPTWSWASVGQPVRFLGRLEGGSEPQRYTHVSDVAIDYTSSSPFGQVRGGYIRLRCKYFGPCMIKYEPNATFNKLIYGNRQFTGKLYFDMIGWEDFASNVSPQNVNGRREVESSEKDISLEDSRSGENVPGQKTLYMLPILPDEGLFVEAIDGARPRYRRVGMYWLLKPEEGFVSLLEASKPATVDNAEVTVGEDGETSYMIEII